MSGQALLEVAEQPDASAPTNKRPRICPSSAGASADARSADRAHGTNGSLPAPEIPLQLRGQPTDAGSRAQGAPLRSGRLVQTPAQEAVTRIDFQLAPYAPTITVPTEQIPGLDGCEPPQPTPWDLLPPAQPAPVGSGAVTRSRAAAGHGQPSTLSQPPSVPVTAGDSTSEALLDTPQYLPVVALPRTSKITPTSIVPDGRPVKALPEFGVDRGKLLGGMWVAWVMG